MKRYPGIILLVLLLCLSGRYAGGQSVKIGYINKDELMKALPEYDSANVKIEKLRNELVGQLATMQDEYEKKNTSYKNESANLPEVLRKTREGELKDLNNRIQLFQVKANQQLNDKNNELIKPVLAKVDKSIRDVAIEQGITLVLDASVLYYNDEKKSINLLPLIKNKLGLK